MGIGEYWCGGPGPETIQLGRKSCCSDHQPSCAASISSSSTSSSFMRKMRWKLIWMNLVKDKSCFSGGHHNNNNNVQYDEFSYSLNFDQGDSAAAVDEPEYPRRSFSVRYADPSSRLNNNNKPPLL